ncbi:hypothetical protein [Algoriphagus faecimaris]|uniref:hypothetical protein n=1 Tax=Algoriphagus faecimaris TaxID=686796 RepID=UPI000B4365FA|nr:hypothetical protein [Algoriphagus faecimaris]
MEVWKIDILAAASYTLDYLKEARHGLRLIGLWMVKTQRFSSFWIENPTIGTRDFKFRGAEDFAPNWAWHQARAISFVY